MTPPEPADSADLEARAREVLFDLATAKEGWTIPEPKAAFSADTAIRAMLTLAAQVNREATERAAKVAEAYPSLEYADIAIVRGIAAAIRQEPRP